MSEEVIKEIVKVVPETVKVSVNKEQTITVTAIETLFISKHKELMEISEILVKQGKKAVIQENSQVIPLQAHNLKQIKKLNIKNIFFHDMTGSDSYNMFFVTESGHTLVFPVHPQCPIQLLTKQGLNDDLEDFKKKKSIEIEESVRNLTEIQNNL